MQISARNVFHGTITQVSSGTVNAEVEIATAGGDALTAIVTLESVRALGLVAGMAAVAYVKAPWVMVLAGAGDARLSARNRLAGTVRQLHRGAVNTEVGIELAGGQIVYAVITNEAALELGLRPGVPATALIKASHVVLGLPA